MVEIHALARPSTDRTSLRARPARGRAARVPGSPRRSAQPAPSGGVRPLSLELPDFEYVVHHSGQLTNPAKREPEGRPNDHPVSPLTPASSSWRTTLRGSWVRGRSHPDPGPERVQLLWAWAYQVLVLDVCSQFRIAGSQRPELLGQGFERLLDDEFYLPAANPTGYQQPRASAKRPTPSPAAGRWRWGRVTLNLGHGRRSGIVAGAH